MQPGGCRSCDAPGRCGAAALVRDFYRRGVSSACREAGGMYRLCRATRRRGAGGDALFVGEWRAGARTRVSSSGRRWWFSRISGHSSRSSHADVGEGAGRASEARGLRCTTRGGMEKARPIGRANVWREDDARSCAMPISPASSPACGRSRPDLGGTARPWDRMPSTLGYDTR